MSIYLLQKRVKKIFALDSIVKESLNPQINSYDDEINQFMYSLFLARTSMNFLIEEIDYNSINKGLDMISNIDKKPLILTSNELYLSATKLINTCESLKHDSKSVDIHNMVSSLFTIFQELWCEEMTSDFVLYIIKNGFSDNKKLYNYLISNPLLYSYIQAAFKPVYDSILENSPEVSVQLAQEMLNKYSTLFPDFLKPLFSDKQSSGPLFWNLLLQYYIKHPYVFGLCTFESYIFHEQEFKSFFHSLSVYFLSEDSSSLLDKIIKCSKSFAQYPSSAHYSSITGNESARFLFSSESITFFNQTGLIKLPKSSIFLLLSQNSSKICDTKPVINTFESIVSELFNRAKLILVEKYSDPYNIVKQIVELSTNCEKEELHSLFQEIEPILNELSMSAFLSRMGNHLDCIENINGMTVIPNYTPQSSLVKNLTRMTNCIHKNIQNYLKYCLFDGISKQVPLKYFIDGNLLTKDQVVLEQYCDIICLINEAQITLGIDDAQILLSIVLRSHNVYKWLIDSSDNKNTEKKMQELYNLNINQVLKSVSDPLIIECMNTDSVFCFFRKQISSISVVNSLLEISFKIISSMKWLSEFLLNHSNNEVGADTIIPLTILAIFYSKLGNIYAINSIFDRILFPMNAKLCLFQHSDYFFLSSFCCALKYFINDM